jgi:hypothetical protein
LLVLPRSRQCRAIFAADSNAQVMKPNIKFLQKVADGGVRRIFGYSERIGGYWRFYGGEVTAKKHAAAGFVEMLRGGPSLGRPVYVTLTDAGRAALSAGVRAP